MNVQRALLKYESGHAELGRNGFRCSRNRVLPAKTGSNYGPCVPCVVVYGINGPNVIEVTTACCVGFPPVGHNS